MMIRPVREPDREAICRVHTAAIQGVATEHYTREEIDVWASFPSPDKYPIDDSSIVFVVAEINSQIVGCAQLTPAEGEVDKVYVQPAHARCGVGRELLHYLEQRAMEQGLKSLSIEASRNAVPFYERLDYRQQGTRQKTLKTDSVTVEMTVVDMEKSL